jgi:hypothetical protein
VNASIVEADLRSGDEVADGLRDEHLARSGMRRDPGADVDGEPGDLALVELALADVDSDRASRPSVRTPSTIACAARIARAVPSKVAKNPSPAVSRSWPRNRASSRRTIAWWRASRSRQARSPTRTAWSVEPTMSVKTTVASTLSGTDGASSPATKRSISSAISGERKSADGLVPDTRIVRAPGIRDATSIVAASSSGNER